MPNKNVGLQYPAGWEMEKQYIPNIQYLNGNKKHRTPSQEGEVKFLGVVRKMDIICPKCGAKSTEKEFVDAFCVDCVKFNIEIPQKIEFDKCGDCSKIYIGGEWKKYSEREVKDYIERKCKGDFESVKYSEGTLVITCKKGGQDYELEKEIEVIFQKKLCNDCSKVRGSYFEAIIQVRGDPGLVEKYTRWIAGKLERYSFVSKIDTLKEGNDIYCGETRQAFKVLSMFKLKYQSSKKLHTKKQGKKMYRTTFVIRLGED